MTEENLIDMAAMRSKKDELHQAAEKIRKGKGTLTRGELSKSLLKSQELVNEQFELVQAMATDILRLSKAYAEAQHNMMLVSAQAFMALEVLKDKGLCTSEELQRRWETIVKEKLQEGAKEQESQLIVPEKKIIVP